MWPGRSGVRRDVAGLAGSSVVAVISVVAIAAALVAFMLDGGAGTSAADPGGQQSSDQPSGDRQSGGPEEPGTATSPAPSPSSDAKRRNPRATAEAEPPVPSVSVEVYNMTAVSGLADSTAAQLRDAGWRVVGIDNWSGSVPASTVYYPAGLSDEATMLAHTLDISRVRGAVAPMKLDRLTVILTADAA